MTIKQKLIMVLALICLTLVSISVFLGWGYWDNKRNVKQLHYVLNDMYAIEESKALISRLMMEVMDYLITGDDKDKAEVKSLQNDAGNALRHWNEVPEYGAPLGATEIIRDINSAKIVTESYHKSLAIVDDALALQAGNQQKKADRRIEDKVHSLKDDKLVKLLNTLVEDKMIKVRAMHRILLLHLGSLPWVSERGSALLESAEVSSDYYIFVSQLRSGIIRQMTEILDYLIHGNAKEVNEARIMGAAVQKAFDNIMRVIMRQKALGEEGEEEDMEKVERIRERYLEILALTEKVFSLRHEGKSREAAALYKQEIEPLINNDLLKKLDTAADDAKQEITNSHHALLTLMLTADIQGIAVIVIISLCAGLFIIGMVRGIVVPLKKLRDGTERIGQGDLGHHIHLATSDEFGQVADSFNRMSTALMNTTVSRDYLDNILQAMHDSLFVITREGEIMSVNTSACDLIGFRKEELIGQQMERYFLPGSLSLKDISEGCSKDSMSYNQQASLIARDNRVIPVLFSSSLMKGSNGDAEGIVCMAVDITERVEAEKKLAHAQEQLVDSAHKAGMADIATGILHNFGNVLNSVNASVEEISSVVTSSKVTSLVNANELLKVHGDDVAGFLTTDERGRKLPQFYQKLGAVLQEDNERIRKHISRIEDKVATMKGIVETQQEYAQSEFYAERENISKIIDDVLRIQKDLIDSSGVRITKASKETQRCRVHKYKLVQVLLNLVKNAVESMKGNDLHNRTKELIIETGQLDEESDYIRIIDNGHGIPPENLIKIFSHGFTTKEKGHGFGLHACANAVTEMGGIITAESQGEYKGASFTVKLPVVTGPGVLVRNA